MIAKAADGLGTATVADTRETAGDTAYVHISSKPLCWSIKMRMCRI